MRSDTSGGLQSTHAILATFINGESGANLFKNGELFNVNSDKRQSLINLFKDLIDKGVFVRDLSPDNIIYSDGRWVAIDTGKIHEGLSSQQAADFYQSVGPKDIGEPARYGIINKWEKFINNLNTSDEDKTHLKNGLHRLVRDIISS